jgi:hypothetical protein
VTASATAEQAPEEREWRIPGNVVLAFYLAVLAALWSSLNVTWSECTFAPIVAQPDTHALRYDLIRRDRAGAYLQARSEHDGVHLVGSGFRTPGVGLFMRGEMVFGELDCPIGIPHRHPQVPADPELVIAFSAKRGVSPLSVVASVSNGRQYLYSARIPLQTDWQETRIHMNELGPGNGNFPDLMGTKYLMLAFDPPTAVDFTVRDFRLLRAPRSVRQ